MVLNAVIRCRHDRQGGRMGEAMGDQALAKTTAFMRRKGARRPTR